MELEFTAFAELSEACSEADEVWPGYGHAQTHRGFGDIEDSVPVQPEAVGFVGSIDQMYEVLALERCKQYIREYARVNVQCSSQVL